MAFDAEGARLFSVSDDRDSALFFAGRARELGVFRDALALVAGKQATVFRIFQGAPGAGKTSLANRLRESHEADLALIEVHERDLATPDALLKRIRRGIVQGSATTGRALEGAGVLAALLRRDSATEAIEGATAGKLLERTRLALHVDEAQVLGEGQAETLRWLHTGGLELPVVCLFTGLSHTKRTLSGIRGLSRLADVAEINVGRMTRAECCESTDQVFDRFGAVGGPWERRMAADVVAEESYGWPQHLFCAQRALCAGLGPAEGTIERLDFDAVREQTARARSRYYVGRVDSAPLKGRMPLVRAVAAQAITEAASDELDVADITAALVEGDDFRGQRRYANVDADQFANAMIEKGILAFDQDDQVAIPIPSMATWLGVPPRQR